MLTKERLQEIINNISGPDENGLSVITKDKFDMLEDQILKEYGNDELQQIDAFIKAKEKEIGAHYGGGTLRRLERLLDKSQEGSRSAIADKRKMIEDCLVYFRSVIMIAESIGMAGTHAEKAARLRGLIELLNSAISKLRKEEHNNLLDNWESFSWSYSDYPYRKVLEEYNDLKRDNDKMRELLEKNNLLTTDLPF